METINKVPKLVLIVDHSSAGSNARFHAVYHACVESIEHLTHVAIQLRTKLTESTQENALIKPLIEHHRAHHAEIPLHINALSAELDNNLHAHFSRARWQSSSDKLSRRFSASLDQPKELKALLKHGRPEFLVVGPVASPRSKSRKAMTSETLAQLRESQFPIIGVGGVSPKSISEGNIPRCDGYAILTPVLNALDDPAKWHQELEAWKPFLHGETR